MSILLRQITTTQVGYYIPIFIVLVYAIIESLIFYKNYSSNKKAIENIEFELKHPVLKKVNQKDSQQVFDYLQITNTLFKEHLKSFFEKEEILKTGVSKLSLKHYLSPGDLVSQKYYWNLLAGNPITSLKIIPGLFVGAGILGTFLGLSIGLAGLDNIAGSEVDVLTLKVDQLISGISAAFITSIIGMGMSIVINLLFTIMLKKVHLLYSEFVLLIDKSYLTSENALLEKNLSIQLSHSPEPITLGEGIEKLIDASEKIESGVSGMAERLAETIGDRIDSFAREMFSTFQGNAGEAVQEGAQKAKDTFTSLVDNLVQVAQELNPLIGNLSSSLKENIEFLYKLVDQLEATLKAYNEQNTTLVNTVSHISVVDDSFQRILQTFQHAITEIATIQDSLERVATVSEKTIDHASQRWDSMGKYAEGVLQNLHSLRTEFDTVSESLGSVFSQINSGVIDYQEAIGKGTEKHLSDYHKTIIDFSSNLSNVALNIEDGIENLSKAIRDLKKQEDQNLVSDAI